jgi:dCTP deaminase
MILSAQSIRRLSAYTVGKPPLVTPFREEQVFHGMTGGVSSAGYDILIDQNVTLYPVTLKNLVLKSMGFKRPSFSLASSIEHFDLPANLMMFVVDKSTWARRGLAVQNTTAEPGWMGYLTLELSNHSDQVIKIKKGSPIAQMIFYELDHPTDKPYIGKYQKQAKGPQPAILV